VIHRIISPIDGSVIAERELADDARVEAVLPARTSETLPFRK
jgi:hypothetical protein